VEDNEINQMVAIGMLVGLGYRTDVANDGVEGLDLLAAHSYDAVLMDCRMPRMDGFSAAAELRRREGSGRHTPIIALTASALVADRVRCIAAGMDDYISKPVNPADLETTLKRWISVIPAHAGAATDPGVELVVAEQASDPITVRLQELRNTNVGEAMIRRVITSFLTGIPRHLTALADTVTADDAATLGDQAHSFKGAASNLGAAGVAAICQRLEDLGRSGKLNPCAADELRRLHIEIGQVETRLRAILDQS
jgi:CheY-like chemotaxis protein